MSTTPTCPNCKAALAKQQKLSTAALQQQRLFPQFVWAVFLCVKCKYETVRTTGKI